MDTCIAGSFIRYFCLKYTFTIFNVPCVHFSCAYLFTKRAISHHSAMMMIVNSEINTRSDELRRTQIHVNTD